MSAENRFRPPGYSRGVAMPQMNDRFRRDDDLRRAIRHLGIVAVILVTGLTTAAYLNIQSQLGATQAVMTTGAGVEKSDQ